MKGPLQIWACCLVVLIGLLSGVAYAAEMPAGIIETTVNPTGEPLGGGEGYSRILLSGDHTVNNREQFVNALAKAKPGEVIYIEPQAKIDLTGYVDLYVPEGITIAGNRGYKGSPGPVIFTSQLETYPSLLRVMGPNVRVTGIQLRGPSMATPSSLGLNILADNVEVDNCEIYEWSYAGIHIMRAKNAYIHHNYIHHVQRPGLGYPVTLNAATALIEANVFDWYRHAIAGAGFAGTGYEARYNWVGPNAISHAFDMHGGTDFCANLPSCTEQEIMMAGDYVNIHHNTFMITSWEAIRIRGIANNYVDVHDNWFIDDRQARSFRFFYYSGGNTHVYNNFYGTNKLLVAELVKPSPFIYSTDTQQIVAMFNGGPLKYGFLNPSPQENVPVRGNLAVEIMPVEVDVSSFGRTFTISSVEIKLDKSKILYSGKDLPATGSVVLDSTPLTDGVHELTLKITGNLEIALEKSVLFQVDNWWDMTDDLDAPTVSGWFGTIDNSRTLDTSPGWTYDNTSADTFNGDISRRVRVSDTVEYLTWKTTRLKEFEITAYAQSATLAGLTLWVSADGEIWQQVAFTTQAGAPNALGWRELTITGALLPAQEANQFRLTLAAGADPAGVQVGKVFFKGLN